MFGHLKRYTAFALCALLLNIVLTSPVHLMATQEISSQDETAQSTENNEQFDEKEIKKPTFTQSWRKVITLRWKELNKADAWNIGVPVVGIAALGAWYYWPKRGGVENVNNPGNDNPGTDLGDLDSDSSSDDDSNDNPDNSILIGLNNELLPEVQTKIASYRYEEFLEKSEKKDNLIFDKLNAKNKAIVEEAIYTKDDGNRELRKCAKKRMICALMRRRLEYRLLSLFLRTPLRLLDQMYQVISTASCPELEGLELRDHCQFYIWIKHNLTIPQVDLINRAWNAMRKNQPFIIYCLSEDGKIFLTFDKTVRMFLLEALDIELKLGKSL